MLLGDEKVISTFKRCKHDITDKPIGIYNDNLLLDTRLYKVDLPDGDIEKIAANATSENLWAQCNEDGFVYQILHEIVDHRTNGQAISIDDAYYDTPSIRKLRKTIIGWELCCGWRDG